MSFFVDLLHRLNGTRAFERRIEDLRSNVSQEINSLSQDLANLNRALATHHEWLPYRGLSAPLFILSDGRLSFKTEHREDRPRVLVNSIPKSGTYLLAAMLNKMDYIGIDVHLWDTGFADFRWKAIPEMVHQYSQFTRVLPLPSTVALTLPGQFAVGHISWTPDNAATLRDFRKIIAVRDMRHALISNMRWFENEGRGLGHPTDWKAIPDRRERMRAFLEYFGAELLHWAESIAGWTEAEDTLLVRFEVLLGDHGTEAQHALLRELAEQLSLELDSQDFDALLATTLNTPTKTWSGSRTCLDDYWSDECESYFSEHGGLKLNQSLSYL